MKPGLGAATLRLLFTRLSASDALMRCFFIRYATTIVTLDQKIYMLKTYL
ncbi:hypothetical protein Hanom_Chr12g01076711 [Helianthus anomalus]